MRASRTARGWSGRRWRSRPLTGVVDPAARRPEHDERDRQCDAEKQPGEGRAVREVLEVERLFVDDEIEEERRAARLTGPVVEDERDEEILEDVDDAEDQRVEDDRRHHRQG